MGLYWRITSVGIDLALLQRTRLHPEFRCSPIDSHEGLLTPLARSHCFAGLFDTLRTTAAPAGVHTHRLISPQRRARCSLSSPPAHRATPLGNTPAPRVAHTRSVQPPRTLANSRIPFTPSHTASHE
ncbi:hypothetical protein AAT19DRAFT_12108 [Rhodotorula toruloides]|uniref:Uncharacterized protein n=1 Tax=Rhodotorula toruloides TaxID=5286 RepID=A0A2T0AFB2_RHOTO|nr:hypothetical protein AAT19DRAFT_12108 [Rhodotorula toruloides]